MVLSPFSFHQGNGSSIRGSHGSFHPAAIFFRWQDIIRAIDRSTNRFWCYSDGTTSATVAIRMKPCAASLPPVSSARMAAVIRDRTFRHRSLRGVWTYTFLGPFCAGVFSPPFFYVSYIEWSVFKVFVFGLLVSQSTRRINFPGPVWWISRTWNTDSFSLCLQSAIRAFEKVKPEIVLPVVPINQAFQELSI